MSWLTPHRLLAGALIGWLLIAVTALVCGAPFGHDESAFAVLARGDAPPWLYRSRGVVVLAELAMLGGGSELAIRIPFVLASACTVLAVFAVGRAAFDAWTGAWAAAVIAGTHVMVLRGAEAIGDLPATACMLGGLAVVIGELSRPGGPRWRFVLAAPCFAAAFYLRYGSAPVIVLAGVTAALLWWRAIAQRPGPVLAAVACLAVLVVPHVLHSIDHTGAWSGVLEISRRMPRRAYLGEGLVTYLTSNPLVFYGAVAAPVMVAGLATGWRGGRAGWLLLVVAVGQLVSLGLQSHGQPRYVFVAVTALVVLGVKGLAVLRRPRLALAAVTVAWVGAAAAVVPLHRGLARSRDPVLAAGETIRADAGDRACAVAARIAPPLIWYARCEVLPVWSTNEPAPWPADRLRYIVSLPGQPVTPELVGAAGATPLSTRDPRARVWVMR